jgi:hypothetical protein
VLCNPSQHAHKIKIALKVFAFTDLLSEEGVQREREFRQGRAGKRAA